MKGLHVKIESEWNDSGQGHVKMESEWNDSCQKETEWKRGVPLFS